MIFLNKFSVILLTVISSALLVTGCADDKSKDSSSAEDISATEAVTEAVTQEETQSVTQPPVRDFEKAEGTYVYDHAGIMSSSAIEQCNNYAEWLYEKYLINTAVVTTDSLGEYEPAEYAENAYNELYGGRGSGLLILINNDTNEDYIYKKGSCLTAIEQELQDNELYYATREIVSGDYESAVMRLLALGEQCSEYVFDNMGVLTAEGLSALESLCEGTDIAVLVTSSGTSQTAEEVCRSYYERRFGESIGYMLMLDTSSGIFTCVTEGTLPAGFEEKMESAQTSAASDYAQAIGGLIEALKG